MKAQKEADVLDACLEYLAVFRRWRCWRCNTGAAKFGNRFVRFNEPGHPDALAIIPPSGRLLCLEAKRPGGKLRESQALWLGLALQAGALALVVTSLDDLRAQLAAAGYPEEGR